MNYLRTLKQLISADLLSDLVNDGEENEVFEPQEIKETPGF